MNWNNSGFAKDVISDLKMIYCLFSENPSYQNKNDLYSKFSLFQIANTKHRQRKLFLSCFFEVVIYEIDRAIIIKSANYFLFLLWILEAVYFGQENSAIKIRIKLEELDSINSFYNVIDKKKITNENITFLDSLKQYDAFEVCIDSESHCILDEDALTLLDEIKRFEEKICETNNFLDKL